jgi:hypothetical protein
MADVFKGLELSSDPSGSRFNLRLAVPFDFVALRHGLTSAPAPG